MPSREVLVDHPVIVVCVPVYNEQRYLERTLSSLRGQTWKYFKVLISDNNSTDGTSDICDKFIKADERFHYVKHAENIGSAGNFNFLLDVTDSKYVMWLGAHDVIESTLIEKSLNLLFSNPESSLAYSDVRAIDEDDVVLFSYKADKLANLPRSRIIRSLLALNWMGWMCIQINHPIRRSALGDARFSRIWGTDQVMLARLAYAGQFERIPEELYQFRRIRDPEEDYMKRLTGRDSILKKEDLLAEFRNLYRNLSAGTMSAPAIRYVADAVVQRRFGIRPRNALAWLWDCLATLGRRSR